MPRIPFAVAIAEPRLLKEVFDSLSLPQQVALKAFYGLPLDNAGKDERGWTELDYYWGFQGFGTHDPLGFLTKVDHPEPYQPHEYREGWGVFGVRAGKTSSLAAPIVAYEALCGGHEDFVRKGRPAICFLIAQDLRMSKYALSSINDILNRVPFLEADTARSWIVNRTADRIELKNNVTIAVCPPTVKSVRGYDAPVAVMDEVGVWYTMTDSANPDSEIYRQVASRQAQFEFPKIVGISSPWAKHGLLYDRWRQGTDGKRLLCRQCRGTGEQWCQHPSPAKDAAKDILVLHAPTAMLHNPLVKREFLAQEQRRDPLAYDREYNAHFAASVSGFLNGPALEACVEVGTLERTPDPSNVYVAAIDPAFRRDRFACAIAHVEEKGVVVDAIRQFVPVPGLPLNPEEVLDQLRPLLQSYAIHTVYTDQYHLESLGQLALQRGLSLEPTTFTASSKAAIFGSLQQLVGQKRLHLLDHGETLHELSMLERRLSANGLVQIRAPEGQHDDLATVVALVCYKSLWLMPLAQEEATEPTAFDRCQAQIARRWHDQGVDLGVAEAIQQASLDALLRPPVGRRVA